MRVTPKEIPMDKNLIEKLDLCIQRCTQSQPKLDALLVVDGYEGYGKTTLSIACMYYAKCQTGRTFDHNNVFIDCDALVDFSKNTKEQLIIWDEAGLGGLSTEWWNKSQIKLIKLLMTVRKRRHFFILNIPRFYKLKDYLINDRALGLIHVYARNEVELGRFVYYNRKCKDILYEKFTKEKKRNYKQFISFNGTFPDVLNPKRKYNILSEFDVKEYDKRKDLNISKIGDDNKIITKKDIQKAKLVIINVRSEPTIDQGLKKLSKDLNITKEAARLQYKRAILLEKPTFQPQQATEGIGEGVLPYQNDNNIIDIGDKTPL